MRNRDLALSGASALILAAVAQPALAQTTPATAPPAPVQVAEQARSQTTVAEIVVTAQKRQENINSVGMSIQAATGATLTKLGVTDTSQLVKIVPGFNYTPSYYGTPIYTIRGVGFNDTSLAASPTVSVYVDEMPLPYSILTSGAALDVQRVEVLKGPQGTLFGENATGGAINFIANKPTDQFQAGLDASYSRFNTFDVTGFAGGPITNTLDFRIALRSLESGPWQKSYTHNATVGSSDFLDGRVSLLWKPTDRFKALLTLSAFQDKGETQMGQLYGFAPLNPANGVDPRIFGTGPQDGSTGPITLGGPGHYPFAPHNPQAADWGACVNKSPLDPPFDTAFNPAQPGNYANVPVGSTNCSGFHKHNTFYSAALRMDYDLGHDMTLTSLTTHEHFDRLTPLDGDGVIFQDYESQQHGRILATYQEVRLAGKFIGKGDWLVGGNYEYDSTWDSFLQSYGGSSATPIFGVIRLGPTNPVDIQQTTTYAVYANGEYPITDSILLQAGIRYTSSKKNFYGCGKDGGDGTWAAVSQAIQNFLESVNNPPGGVQDQGVNPGPGGCGTTGPGPTYNPQNFTSKLDEDNVSWRTGINWKPLPGQLLYFNVSQGWKSGSFPTVATSAFSQLAPAKQEGLLAYEGGFKSSLLDRTLQVNGAVFYYDYKDKQILGALDDPIFGALPALVNVPNSHVIGFEVSGVWQPVHGLTITPSVTYAHSNIDSCTVAQNANCIGGRYHNFDAFATYADFGNEPFPNAPEWSADVDGQYEWELPGNMTAFVGVNVNYQGYTRGFFYDRSAPLQPANILENPAHTLVDLRAGVDKDAWRFQLWGRNITNEYYWQSSVHVNDVLLHYAGMPATYGATISYRFQ